MSSDKHARRDGLKPKVIALSVAACFGFSAPQALANPTGGTVVSGSANFASSGNTLTITNSANAIINWQNFSIGVNEITRFLQTSGSSAVLNRVVGANGVIPQSIIDGVLSSNGRVFLINPSGIIIGSSGRIDAAGFIASSLSLSDQDFKAGRMRFTETPGAGKVSNAGTIDTSSAGPGGRVWLIGPDVENSGVIRTPQGEIILAAGKSVELVSESSPFVTVNITADDERALNVGQLLADSGRIGMFGALVRQSGLVQADSAVVGANGEIRLVATRDLTLDEGSRTTANGPGGGTVTLQAQGGTNLIYGTVEAKGSSGQGGTIEALGVRVGVLGHGVIDASGDTGGGTVLVGGDQHGANPNIQNAEQTLIGPDGVIRADAATTGDGGRVIVWSDAETRVLGSISARGGSQSGNGGFVETSSKGDLDVNRARIDTHAPNGRWGTWLLDPTNVILEPNSYGAGDPLAYAATFGTNPGTTAHITEQTVEAGFAANGTVKIQASNDVGFRTDLTLVYSGPSTPGLFEVRAVNNIDMAYGGTGAHTITSNGTVVLSANDVDGVGAAGVPQLNTVSGTGSIIGGGNIRTDYGGVPGGDISLSGYGVTVGTLETMGGVNRVQVGNITIVALGGGISTGTITTRGANGSDFVVGQPPTAGGNGGTINITAGYGSVSTGAIDASGGKGGNGGYASGQVFSGASGGSGGSVTIGTTTYGPVVSITAGSIKSTGGVGGLGGSGGNAYAYSSLIFDIAYGGDGGSGGVVSLSAGSVTTGAVDVSGGNAGAGGGNNSLTVYGGVNGAFSGSGDLFLGFGGDGGTGGQFFVNSNGFTGGSLTASGGAGGAGGSGNTAITIVNGAPATVTQATGSANVGDGGFGGSGGSISLNTMGPVNVAGSIITVGGVGGAGGAGSKANASVYGTTNASSVFGSAEAGLGGGGGGGGTVSVGGTTMTVNGTISTGGGAGGAGGNNSTAIAYASTLLAVSPFFQATADAGIGGDAGFSGGVTFTGGTIKVGDINAAPAAPGAGGTGSSASVSGYGPAGTGLFLDTQFGSGGFQGSGGFVDLIGPTGVTTGAIDVSGARPGSVTIQSVSGDISTGPITARSLSPASQGGGVSLSSATGRIVVNGNIDARGSDGLGVLIDTCNDACIGFGYGGSAGGYVNIARTGQGDPAGGAPAIQVTGTIVVSGGDGFSPQGAAGGNGGSGGAVGIQAAYGGSVFYGSVSIGGMDAHGGRGGSGATGFNGGSGGIGGTFAVIAAGIATGQINIAGGNGGAGGADAGNTAGYGGNGGSGGFVTMSAYSTITVGDVIAMGGDGGNGGASSIAGSRGGNGGNGGQSGVVDLITNLAPGTSVSTGNINVSGGRGGNGGDATAGYGGAGGYGGIGFEAFVDPENATVGAIAAAGGAGGSGGYGGIQGGAGGAGGSGATVSVSGIAYGGVIAVGNIDVSGGAGGAGGGSGGANVYGGSGGAGGFGGSVDVFGGTIDLKSGGTINAAGGAGGAGGSGTAAYGGNGGAGGYGGFVDLFALAATGPGSIFVSAPPNFIVDGGAGGAGGVTGGLAGLAGLAGSSSLNGSNVIIQGTSQSLDANTVINGTQLAGNPNNAPSSDDLQKKNEEKKKQNQVAACK